MEFAEAIYEGAGAPSQTKQPQVDANRDNVRGETWRGMCLAFSL